MLFGTMNFKEWFTMKVLEYWNIAFLENWGQFLFDFLTFCTLFIALVGFNSVKPNNSTKSAFKSTKINYISLSSLPLNKKIPKSNLETNKRSFIKAYTFQNRVPKRIKILIKPNEFFTNLKSHQIWQKVSFISILYTWAFQRTNIIIMTLIKQ